MIYRVVGYASKAGYVSVHTRAEGFIIRRASDSVSDSISDSVSVGGWEVVGNAEVCRGSSTGRIREVALDHTRRVAGGTQNGVNIRSCHVVY